MENAAITSPLHPAEERLQRLIASYLTKQHVRKLMRDGSLDTAEIARVMQVTEAEIYNKLAGDA